VYQAKDAGFPKPLIVLVPPLTGSVSLIEPLCVRLGEEGFTVLTYSRLHLDNPAVYQGREYHVSLYESLRQLWTTVRGLDSGRANQAARMYEEKRRADIEWLLDRIGEPELGRLIDRNAGIIAAGYGAGGAALSLLASSPLFTSRHPEILGFVSIEGPPAWALERERFPWDPRKAFFEPVQRFFLGLTTRKLSAQERIEPLLIPSLFITSDHIKEEAYRESRYKVLLAMARNAGAPSRIASAAGAGFLDYTDGAAYYPLYQFLLPRPLSARSVPPEPALDRCAALIADFAAALTPVNHEWED
jgi:hypothetical protein